MIPARFSHRIAISPEAERAPFSNPLQEGHLRQEPTEPAVRIELTTARYTKNVGASPPQQCPEENDSAPEGNDVASRASLPSTAITRPTGTRRGPSSPSWKGGRLRASNGQYIEVYAPDHPWPRKKPYIYEHVRVMELHIGRRLAPNEVVHHIDHNPQNNTLENLQLVLKREHSQLHADLRKAKTQHGTWGMLRRKCRCEICHAAAAAYMREKRRRQSGKTL